MSSSRGAAYQQNQQDGVDALFTMTPEQIWTAARDHAAMTDARELLVDVLEDAAFKGTWRYPSELTALEAAIETADVILAAGLTVTRSADA